MTRARTGSVGIDEVRDGFLELVERVARTGEAVTIERDGEPQAVVVPAGAWNRTAEGELANDAGEDWEVLADRARDLIRRDLGGQPLPDLVELIRSEREERDDQLLASVVDPLRGR